MRVLLLSSSSPAARTTALTSLSRRLAWPDLFQLAPDGTTKTLISNITCSNGTAFSPADDVIYFIDSPSGTIDAYDYSVADGSFSNKRTVVSLPPQSEEDKGVRGEGGFDGMCADEDGNLYVALWQRASFSARARPLDPASVC